MLLLRYALLTKNEIQKVPGDIPSENLFPCLLRISFQLLHITIFLPISSHFSLILFSSRIISVKSSFSLSSMRRAFSASGSIAGALFNQSNIALSSALLTTATAMIIFFVVRIALIRAVVPVCLICAVVWIVLICVMVQLFFAVGVARYSVFFTHFSFSFNLRRFRIRLLSLSRDAHKSVFRLPSSVEINPLFLRWYHDGK